MAYVITEPCIDVKDKTCVEECAVDCIYEGQRMLYIHPDECVDCGACEPVCPVEAIFYEDDVPEQWSVFTAENIQVLRPARIAWRRLQDRPAALRHRLRRQLRHQPLTAPRPTPPDARTPHREGRR
jgi:NAD-dependent dihydropyrimidine dehydrogenase PreA subunit